MGFSNGISEPICYERIERDPDSDHDTLDAEFCAGCDCRVYTGRFLGERLMCLKCHDTYTEAFAKAKAFLGLPDSLELKLAGEPRIGLRDDIAEGVTW